MLTITTPLSDTDLMALESAKVVDARGSACPGPLLEAKKAHEHGPGRAGHRDLVERPGDQERHRGLVGEGRPHLPRYLPGEGYERVFVMRQK